MFAGLPKSNGRVCGLRPANSMRPIPLPKGKKLVTLRDAAEYITKLPKAEHDAEEWLAAMEALLLVAEHDGCVYRKLKPGRNDGEAHRGSGVNE